MEQHHKSKGKGKADKNRTAAPVQDAGIMTLLRNQTGVTADQEIYSAASSMDRTILVVDLSKLEAEGDTLVGALVLYHPEHELKKSRYEQRCSQLIGIALCMKNFTGKYPKYVHLKGSGFAIRSLGGVYVMGLSSRLEEPSSCVVSLAELIHSMFQFYHHSPDRVRQSCNGDWTKFTAAMSGIFSSITNFLAKDKHSVPAMFGPLPYIDTTTCKKSRQELYLVSSRVLRSCQNLDPVIGGCIMYNSKLVLSQFPSSLTEMLVIIGSGVMNLKQESILKDEVVPDKVWLLQVFLTSKQKKVALHHRDTISTLQESYSTMDANPQLSNSTVQWRFQPTASSAVGSAKQIKKQSWSRRTQKNRITSFNSSSSSSSSSSKQGKKDEAVKVSRKPFSTSTPQQQQQQQQQQQNRRHGSDNISLLSMDAVLVSPGLASVSFNNDHIKDKRKTEALLRQDRKTSQSSQDFPHGEGPDWIGSGSMMNDTDELYLDAVDVDPAMALGPKMLHLFSNSSVGEEKESRKGGNVELRLNDDEMSITQQLRKGSLVHGTGSTSSEGFATPSPTPPQRSSFISMAGCMQRDDSAGPDIASSFKTANESFLCGTDEEVDKERGKDGGFIGRQPNAKAAVTSGVATLETLENHLGPRKDVKAESSKLTRKRFDSDDDDFVDSEDLERLLEMAHLKPSNGAVDSYNDDHLHLTDSLPPPVPRRNASAATTGSTSSSTQYSSPTFDSSGDISEVPPVPPHRLVSTKQQHRQDSDNSKLCLSSLTRSSDLPSLVSEDVDGEKEEEEEEEEEEDENYAPPLPPRRQVSSPELMLSGTLEAPLQLPNHSEAQMVSSQRDESGRAAKVGSPKSDIQASWIYGTMNRGQNPESMRDFEDEEDGGMANSLDEEELKLVDGPEPKENFTSTELMTSPTASRDTCSDNQISTANTDGEAANTGQANSSKREVPSVSNGEDATVTEQQTDLNKHEMPAELVHTDTNSSSEQANSASSNKEESLVNEDETSGTEQENSLTASQEGSSKIDTFTADDTLSRTAPAAIQENNHKENNLEENHGKIHKENQDESLEENHDNNLTENGEKNGEEDQQINHYEFDDYSIVEETGNNVPGSKVQHGPIKNDMTPPADEHIYEFDDDDDYDDIGIGREEKEGNVDTAGNSSLRFNRFEGRRYEDISDDVLFNRRTRGTVTESESSEVAKMDVDDSESKTSSMTVTLDLSHIDKNDPLYSSAGDNRISSHSGSVEIPRVPNTDFISNESSEEAGRDGMVTPVEITYNESMFNMVREKLETHAEGTDAERTKTAARRDDDDAMSNDSAEYSSLPDEDESLLEKNLPRISSEVHKRTKNWLSRTMERPIFVSEEGDVIEKFNVYVQCYMDTYIILLTEPDLHKNKYKEDILHELWRPLAEQLLYLDSILEHKKERIETCKLTNCIATYSSREKLCEAKPLSAAYHFRHAVRRAHQEYARDPSLRQLSLSKEHCRMLSQNIHGREVYVQPSGCAGDAMCLHALIERSMKAKTSATQQPSDTPKVMLI